MFKFIELFLFSLVFCVFAVPSEAAWEGWKWGDKQVDELSFWDDQLVKKYDEGMKARFALEANLGDKSRIMRIDREGQLSVHQLRSYSSTDFKTYRKTVDDYEVEQQALGNYINGLVRKYINDSELVSLADKFFRKLVSVSNQAEWAKDLQAELYAARMGISSEVFDLYPDFESFVRANYLHKHFALHNHPVELGESDEPILLVQGEKRPWSEVQDVVEVDSKGRMVSHFYTYKGFVEGQTHTVIRPFKNVGDDYDGRYIVEIMTVDAFPPHTWVRLISGEGELYSIGYWGETPLTGFASAMLHLVPEEGRVIGPDLFEITAKATDLRATPVEITQEQFEDVLEFTREYQQDSDVCYQILDFSGQNCAGFVQVIADRLDLDVTTSSWLIPFNNPYDVASWQKKISQWRRDQLELLPSGVDEETRLDIYYGLPD